MANDALLRLKNLKISTPAGRTLGGPIDLTLAPGQIVILKGENGSGKTTLVKTVLGLHKAFRGEVIKKFSSDEVSYLPQLGNVGFFLPLTLGDVLSAKHAVSGEQVMKVGLLSADSLGRPWNTASGGERQKVLLSRIFLDNSRVLILDEPFNHLDARARAGVVRLILAAAQAGSAVLLISHTEIPELHAAQTVELGVAQDA